MAEAEKYYDTIKYGNFKWPGRYNSLGRGGLQPMSTYGAKSNRKFISPEEHLDMLMKKLKETDWE